MPTKALTLSLFMAAPHSQFQGAYNSPIWQPNWASWRLVAPWVENYNVGYYGNFGPSRPYNFTDPIDPMDYGYFPFATTAYPVNVTINRATNTDGAEWDDEFFELRVMGSPYRRRSVNVETLSFNESTATYTLHEWCVDVEVDCSELYLTRDYGGYSSVNGQPLGRFYAYPGDLFNIDLEWKASVIYPQIVNGVPDTVRLVAGLHFRGGVQEVPAYTKPQFLASNPPVDYYDGDGNLIPIFPHRYPVENFYDVDTSVTGLKVSVADQSTSVVEDPLYKVGWSIEATTAEHGWPVNIGVLESPSRYGFTFLNEPGEGMEVVLPHQYSHFGIKRTYFTVSGRMFIVGRLSFDPSARFGVQDSEGRRISIALPEQRTAVSVDGPFIEMGANRPVQYQYSKSIIGLEGIIPETFDPALCAIKIYSFKDPSNEGREDVSAPVMPSGIYLDGRMIGSGLSLSPNSNNAVFATWWRSLSTTPYIRILSYDGFNGQNKAALKRGAKWFEKKSGEVIPETRQSVAPLDSFRFNSRFIPSFNTATYYEWSPFKAAYQAAPFYEPPQAVTLKFMRHTSGYLGDFPAPEYFTIAELDYLPFGHMPLLSAHEYQQHAPKTRLAGSTLWATNGVDGCWESNDIGTTWAPRTDWTPAFEEPFTPLDVAILPSGPLSWGALALLLPEGGNPIIYYRLTHDGGLNWENEVEVGELPPTAWVWGCSLFSGHHHKQSYLLIANSDRLMWISHDTGATWTALEPPEEES